MKSFAMDLPAASMGMSDPYSIKLKEIYKNRSFQDVGLGRFIILHMHQGGWRLVSLGAVPEVQRSTADLNIRLDAYTKKLRCLGGYEVKDVGLCQEHVEIIGA